MDSRVEARTRQLATAAEIGRAAASILTAEDLLARSAELIHDRFGFDHVLIFLVDDNARSVVLSEAAGPAAAQLKAGGLRYALNSGSLIGWVASNRQPHAARRVAGDELFTPNDLLPETRSEAGLPLRVGDRLIGAMAVHSRAPDAFDASELEVLQALADQISVALENGRLFARQESVARLEQQVAALTARIHGSLTLDAILENAAGDLGRLFGASKVVVRLPRKPKACSSRLARSQPPVAMVRPLRQTATVTRPKTNQGPADDHPPRFRRQPHRQPAPARGPAAAPSGAWAITACAPSCSLPFWPSRSSPGRAGLHQPPLVGASAHRCRQRDPAWRCLSDRAEPQLIF